MVLQSYWKSAVAGALVALMPSAPAEACSRVALAAIHGFQTLPAEGSRVPRSTSLWLRSDLPLSERGDTLKDASAVRLLDERGKSVALMSTGVRVTGEQVATLFVLKPMALLEANASYRIELNGAVLSRFSTSEEVDTQPPELPRAKLTEVKGEKDSAYGCGGPSEVTVTLDAPGDVNFLVQATATSTTMPGSALAVASGAALTAVSVPEGMVDLRVLAFDLSGNLATSSEKLTTFVPSDAAGCSSTLAGPGLGALALVALRRRRRR
ncbi:MAG: hypothetical protein IAE78_25585 [Myxococcus sp.]|nr:hypothetical protein [Myxococcus sp.]